MVTWSLSRNHTVFCEVRDKYMYNVGHLLLQRAEVYIDVNPPLWQLYCDRPHLFIRSKWWRTAVRPNSL